MAFYHDLFVVSNFKGENSKQTVLNEKKKKKEKSLRLAGESIDSLKTGIAREKTKLYISIPI